MMKIKNHKLLAIKILIAINVFIYIIFLYSDFLHKDLIVSIDAIKYISILICFTISLMIGKDYISKNYRYLLQVGLLFTVLADTCLLILGYFKLGVVFFCIVQIIYYKRYTNKNCKTIIKDYTILLVLTITVYFIISSYNKRHDTLFPIAIFYSICLIKSVMGSIEACKQNKFPFPNKFMIVLGMILFLLCDISVAMYNIANIINIDSNYIKLLIEISYPFIWLFYLPSQLLLSLSGYRLK